jgi:hypothetical protein
MRTFCAILAKRLTFCTILAKRRTFCTILAKRRTFYMVPTVDESTALFFSLG